MTNNKIKQIKLGTTTYDIVDAAAAKAADLAAVATSGSYNDLSNKPTIPTIPTALKNPNSITIKANSDSTGLIVYDGSAAKTFIIKPSTTAGAFIISDGTTEKTIQLAGKFTDTTYSNATTSKAGLMSTTDKTNLDTIVESFNSDDADTTIDTIKEVLKAFENAPEGTNIVNALAGKVDKVSGKGLSTNDLTAALKANYDAAYTHSTSTHARTDATKVEASSTNGKIKINGTETTVYTHPGSGTNPHGTTKSDVGLGNVGNFKAVSTVASQGLTSTEKANARANIGAGTSSFSGSYNDLTNKPTIPTNTNQTIKSGTTTFGANDAVDIVAGNNVTITPDATNKKITISSTDTNTNTTYDLSAAKNKSNGSVTLDLTAGGSGSGTDSVTIKGTGATTVTTDANGVITISSTDNNTDTHYTKYLQIKGNGTEAIKYTQNSDKSLNLKPGDNVSISAVSGEITINATDTNTWRPVVDNLTSTATDSSLSAAQGKALNDKFADYLPKAGGSLHNSATLKFTMYGSRTVTISGNSIDADMSADEGTWAGNFATLTHSKGTTAMLGWYGSKDNGLYHIFMGGPYNDPAMKMDASGNFTFKNTITGTITNATQLGGVDASSYLTSVPNLAASKITSGTFDAARIPSLASSKITTMTSYSKPSSTSAISTSDSLNTAIGKLEKALDAKQDKITFTYNSTTKELTIE